MSGWPWGATSPSLHALDKMQEKPLALVKAAFEWKAMALAGYEPLIDGCAVCGAAVPEEPRFHLREGVLHCAFRDRKSVV